MTRAEIVAAARECLGTPFRHQGRQAGTALDCAGLVLHVAARIGTEHFDVAGYGRNPAGGLLEATVDSQPGLCRVANWQPGDVLLMRIRGEPQHLGICTDIGILHAYAIVRKVCEHRIDDAWRNRIVRAYAFVGVTA